jgi:hypothetical protein
MNGIAVIKANGDEHTLRFGMVAVAEFERRMFTNPTASSAKILIDLIYAGMYGEAMRSEKPAPTYTEAYDIHESIAEDAEDYAKQMERVWTALRESKHGLAYLNSVEAISEAIDKKKEQKVK